MNPNDRNPAVPHHPQAHDELETPARRVPRRTPTLSLETFEEVPEKKPLNLRDALAMGTQPREEEFKEPEDDLENQPEDKAPAGFPDWAIVPPAMRFPRGKKVWAIRIRAEMTDYPKDGERQVICWGLTYNDEKYALKRVKDDHMRVISEFTLSMIRAIDGEVVDLATAEGRAKLERWWEKIGIRGRSLLQAHYVKTHNVSEAQKIDFFVNCVAEVDFG